MRLLLLLLAPVVTAAFVLSRRQQRDPPPSPWQGPTWRERFAERLKDPRTQGFLTGAGLVGAGFAADRLRVTMAERKRYGSKDTKAPFRRQETELTSAQSDQLWKMQQYERHIRGGVEEYEYQQCLESEVRRRRGESPVRRSPDEMRRSCVGLEQKGACERRRGILLTSS